MSTGTPPCILRSTRGAKFLIEDSQCIEGLCTFDRLTPTAAGVSDDAVWITV